MIGKMGLRLSIRLWVFIALCIAGIHSVTYGQVFVTSWENGTVGEYTTSGSAINVNFITGLSFPEAIAISGADIFVANAGTGTIGEYTLSGAPVNSSLISGLSQPSAIAVSGSDLFVTNYLGGNVGEYTTSGQTINSSLISGLYEPTGIVATGSDLFVSGISGVSEFTMSGGIVKGSFGNGDVYWSVGITLSGSDLFVVNNIRQIVTEYTTSGTEVASALISNLDNPQAIAVDGEDIYITCSATPEHVAEYTTSGQTINSSIITTAGTPYGIAIEQPTPEPTSFFLACLGIMAAFLRRPFRQCFESR